MRAGLVASGAAHGLVALACLVTWHAVPVTPPEVAGRLEVVFGKSARTDGAPANAVAQPPAPDAAANPAAPASPGDEPLPPPAASASGAVDTFAPVRLGEGKIGFDVPAPDAGLVEAQSDPGNRPPVYPDGAYARRERGMTVLGIHVGLDGTVARIDLLQSSGHSDLDEAARVAVLRWRFVPQLRDGAAVPSYREQAISFVL